jgi:hypothetical protein
MPSKTLLMCKSTTGYVEYVFKDFCVVEEGSDYPKASSHLSIPILHIHTKRKLTAYPQSLRQLAHKLAALPPDGPIRHKHETLLLSKLYDIGILPTASKLSSVENSVTV